MKKKKLGELTVAIEATPRGFKAALCYDDGPTNVLAELKGKTEDEILAKAKEWIAKRTPKKILVACVRCRNGVELEKKTTKGVMQIRCNACGAVVYRGEPISWM